MAGGKFSITALIGVDSSMMSRGLSKAGAKMKAWAKKAMATMRAAIVKGVAVATAALGVFGVKSVKEFASFEKGMLEVFTLLPGASKEAMAKMEADVLRLATKMGVLPEQVVPALYQALSAGVPADNVFGFLEQAAKSAKGGVATLTESVSVLTSITNAYGPENLSAADTADILFTTVAKGVTNFGQLAASLYNVVPSAAAAGVSFDQVGAAIAALTAAGTPTSVATTQIRSAILSMMAPNKAMAKAFQEAGMDVSMLAEIMKQPGGLLTAMQLVEKASAGDTTALKKMMGSVEGLAALLTITKDSGKGFVELLEAFADRAGSSTTAFQGMDKGLSRSWEKIAVSMKVAMLKMGKALAPFVQAAVPTILRIIQMIESIPWTKIMQGFARVWLLGIRPYLQSLARAILSLPWANLLTTLLPVATIVIKTIQNLIKIAHGLAPSIVPGIAVLANFFVLMYARFFLLVALIAKLAPDIGRHFKNVFEIGRTAMLAFFYPSKENFIAFGKFVKNQLIKIGDHFKDMGSRAWTFLKDSFSSIRKTVGKVVGDMVTDINNKIMEFLSKIPGFNKMAEEISRTWADIKSDVVGEFKMMIGAFEGFFGTASQASSALQPLIDLVKKDLVPHLQDLFISLLKIGKAMFKFNMMIIQVVMSIVRYLAPALKTGLGVAFKIVGTAVYFLIKGLGVVISVFSQVIQVLALVFEGLAKLKPFLLWLTEAFGGFAAAVMEGVKAIWGGIEWLYNALKKATADVAVWFVEAWNQIKTDVGKVFEAFINWIKALGAWVYKILFGSTITKDFKKAFDYIRDVVMAVLDKIQSIFETVFEGIKMGIDGVSNAFKSMGDFVSKIFDKILSLGGKLKDLVGGLMKGVGGALGGIFEKITGGGGGNSSAGPRAGGGGSRGGITSGSLTTSLKPIVEKLTSMDGSLKSIDNSLKGKFVNQ